MISVGLFANGSCSRTSYPAAIIVFRMSSAMRSRPILRKAPARRPAILLCPPSSRRDNKPEASRIVARTARISVADVVIRRGFDEGRIGRKDAQAFQFAAVRRGRQRGPEIEQRRPVREASDAVARARRSHPELARHGPVAAVQRQGLFGRQAPVFPKTLF